MRTQQPMPTWVLIFFLIFLVAGCGAVIVGWTSLFTHVIAVIYALAIGYALLEHFPSSTAEELLATRVGLVAILGSALAGMVFGGVVGAIALIVLIAVMVISVIACVS